MPGESMVLAMALLASLVVLVWTVVDHLMDRDDSDSLLDEAGRLVVGDAEHGRHRRSR